MNKHICKAKKLDNGEWVQGFYSEYVDNIYENYDIVGNETINIIQKECHFDFVEENRFEVDPNTVCRYTGLEDKNGVPIFEGDIDNSDGEKMYVAWHNGDAAYGLKYLHPHYSVSKDYLDTCILWGRTQMVGNIHDREV